MSKILLFENYFVHFIIYRKMNLFLCFKMHLYFNQLILKQIAKGILTEATIYFFVYTHLINDCFVSKSRQQKRQKIWHIFLGLKNVRLYLKVWGDNIPRIPPFQHFYKGKVRAWGPGCSQNMTAGSRISAGIIFADFMCVFFRFS